MSIIDKNESPILIKISFNKLIEHYEAMAKSEDAFIAAKAQRVLKAQEPYPELRDGFSDYSLLETYKKEIGILLEDSFSEVLTHNEIKTASVPFEDIIFNSSKRFQSIIEEAGDDFELTIKNMPEDYKYIIACTIILNFVYGYDLNFKRPFFYEIPDENGIMRYYKILYNADFMEIEVTDKAREITQKDYDELLDNFDNLELWKEKFPPDSYIFKGFVISNIFDVTDDQSISNVKSKLIAENRQNKDQNLMDEFHEIFRSLFKIKDLKVGFSAYNKEENTFERVYGEGISSYLLHGDDNRKCKTSLCRYSYDLLLKDNKIFSVSDVNKFHKISNGMAPQLDALKAQGIQSAIFAPIADEEGLMGIMELVSDKPKLLNSINANKLVDIMPFIVAAVQRSKKEEENLIEAIIQQECTAIHPSVKWKFEREAKRFLTEDLKGNQATFNKIAFEDVYPLYGQIDIKGSSQARNNATQQDLTLQLNSAKRIIEKALENEQLPIYEQVIYQINEYLKRLKDHFQVDSEHQITSFFRKEITPLFEHLQANGFEKDIEAYFNTIDDKLEVLYKNRKDYDDTITMINKKMASLLDNKQEQAQHMYPHFFERFKTDGVEHNMYIGESITKEDSFNPIYLYNLRLWQLQVMCEMENAYYQMQSEFPIALDVASMILVFNSPLTISFRMDEKQFDVDGTYNARYEIVKKRVDKAFIKGTNKRITEKGKITIVYSQKEDEIEYMRYIKFLQSKNYLDEDIEIVELQDLQAVTGLKAIRVNVLYHKDQDDKEFYTYNDLMKEIKA